MSQKSLEAVGNVTEDIFGIFVSNGSLDHSASKCDGESDWNFDKMEDAIA